jgi:hypothetical protein
MAINHNRNNKSTDRDQRYSDNTFGSPVVFISTESPFNLLPAKEKAPVAKNSKVCRKCGTTYNDTLLKICIHNGGRCGGKLEPLTETEHSKSTSARPAPKLLIEEGLATPSSDN